MRHFRPNFLHGHAECAKPRKLMAGIFLFQFRSPDMVVFVPPCVTMEKPSTKRVHTLRAHIQEV